MFIWVPAEGGLPWTMHTGVFMRIASAGGVHLRVHGDLPMLEAAVASVSVSGEAGYVKATSSHGPVHINIFQI